MNYDEQKHCADLADGEENSPEANWVSNGWIAFTQRIQWCIRNLIKQKQMPPQKKLNQENEYRHTQNGLYDLLQKQARYM